MDRGAIAKKLGIAYGVVYAATKSMEGLAASSHGGRVMIEVNGEKIGRADYIRAEFEKGRNRREIATEVGCDYAVVWSATKPAKAAEVAEDAGAEIVRGDGMFDMIYGWDSHHLMKAIVKGEKNVYDWDNWMTELSKKYEKDDIIMNFTQNHDENSWNGTQGESFGEAGEVMTVLSYMMPGMPLIYSGMEYDMNVRLKFFEKDLIPKTKGKYFPIYEKLGTLKSTNIALNGGKNPASYVKIITGNSEKVLAFMREKEGKKVVFLANLSNVPVETLVEYDGTFNDVFSGNQMVLSKGTKVKLNPWQYYVLE